MGETGFRMEGQERLARALKDVEQQRETISKLFYDIHEHEMTVKVLWAKVFELQRVNDTLRIRIEDMKEREEAKE